MEKDFYRVFYQYDITPRVRFMNTDGLYEYAKGETKSERAYVKAESRAEAEQIKADMIKGKGWKDTKFLSIV